eukprot:5099348-Ditylum_brightwellii.AAC.1
MAFLGSWFDLSALQYDDQSTMTFIDTMKSAIQHEKTDRDNDDNNKDSQTSTLTQHQHVHSAVKKIPSHHQKNVKDYEATTST